MGATVTRVISDADAPDFVFSGDLDYVGPAIEFATTAGTALICRLRGLPFGRRWIEIESLGAPLAALAGFIREGEPGVLSGIEDERTALLLFAAAGAAELLSSSWATAALSDQSRVFKQSMLELAVTSGSLSVVSLLRRRNVIVNDTLVAVALRSGQMPLVNSLLADADFAIAHTQSTLATAAANAIGELSGEGSVRLDVLIKGFTLEAHESSGWPFNLVKLIRDLFKRDASIIRWAQERRLSLGSHIVHRLAAGGNLVALKTLDGVFVQRALSAEVARCAVFSGDLAVLSWVLEQKCPVNASVLTCAAELLNVDNARFALLRALVNHGVPLAASGDNQADVVALIARASSEITVDSDRIPNETNDYAAMSLAALRELRSRNPPTAWDLRVFEGSVEVIRFAVEQGAPIGSADDQTELMRRLIRAGRQNECKYSITMLKPRLQALLVDAGFATPYLALQDALSVAFERDVWENSGMLETVACILELGLFTAASMIDFPLSSFYNDEMQDDQTVHLRLLTLLSANGWEWDAASSCYFFFALGLRPIGMVRPHFASTRCAIYEARLRGCEVSGASVASAAVGWYGYGVLKACFHEPDGYEGEGPLLPHIPLPADFKWDERVLSARNLATWQFAVQEGCPFTSASSCTAFEECARLIEIAYENASTWDAEVFEAALGAAELHRWWLRTRLPGCPCRSQHAKPPRFRTEAAIESIYSRGWDVVAPFLLKWSEGMPNVERRSQREDIFGSIEPIMPMGAEDSSSSLE